MTVRLCTFLHQCHIFCINYSGRYVDTRTGIFYHSVKGIIILDGTNYLEHVSGSESNKHTSELNTHVEVKTLITW